MPSRSLTLVESLRRDLTRYRNKLAKLRAIPEPDLAVRSQIEVLESKLESRSRWLAEAEANVKRDL